MTNTNKNVILNILKTIFSIVFPVISVRYATTIIGVEGIGKINFANSIVSYFSIFASLGMQTYAIRECSKVINDRKRINKVASELFSINLISTIIVYFVLIIILLTIKRIQNYNLLIIISSIQIILTTLGTDWINMAAEDYSYITIRTILFQILAIICMFVYVKSETDYIKYAFIMSVVTNGYYIINIFYRKKYSDIEFTFNINIKQHWRPIVILFSSMLLQTIFNNIDVTIIGLTLGDTQVGIYSIAIKIINLVNQVIASIAFVLMPQLTIEFTNRNYNKINDILRYSLGFIITFGLPCIVGLSCLSTEIIFFIAGEEFFEASKYLLMLNVSLGLSFLGGFMGNMILLPSGRDKIFFLGGFISLIFDIVICWLFIPKYGLAAASIARIVYQLIGIIIPSLYIKSEIKISNIKDLIIAPILGSIMIFIISYYIKKILINRFIILLVVILLSMVVYIIILLLFKNKFFKDFIKIN